MNKEMFTEWKNSEATQEIFNYLEVQRATYMVDLANDAFDEQMRQKVCGRIQAYNDLLMIEHGDT